MPTLSPPQKPRKRHRKRDEYGRLIPGLPVAGWVKFLLLLALVVTLTIAFERFTNR